MVSSDRTMPASHALILDDDPIDRETLQETLAGEGWIVDAHSRSGLVKYLKLLRKPDIVLLDVSDPAVAPQAAAASLRIHYGPELPILAMSEQPELKWSQRIDAFDFLRKPIDERRLLERIARGQSLTERSARLRAHSDAALDGMRRLRGQDQPD